VAEVREASNSIAKATVEYDCQQATRDLYEQAKADNPSAAAIRRSGGGLARGLGPGAARKAKSHSGE